MKIDRGFQVSGVLAQYGKNLNYGIVPPPIPAARLAESGGALTWMGGYCYAVPSTARQKEGAWALIRFLSSDRGQDIICESERQTLESQGPGVCAQPVGQPPAQRPDFPALRLRPSGRGPQDRRGGAHVRRSARQIALPGP